MNASCSSDASEHSSPLGREPSSSLSWSSGEWRQEGLRWWRKKQCGGGGESEVLTSGGVIVLITFNFKVKNRCAGLHLLLVSFWTSLSLSVLFFLCIFCKRVWIGCVFIWILMFSNLWNFKNWEVLMVKVLKRQDFAFGSWCWVV
jgi:hypothetical protein